MLLLLYQNGSETPAWVKRILAASNGDSKTETEY